MRLFTKAERSTFPYWFAHWRAFQQVALKYGCWKIKYLFHDFEKPWLMWLWKDYKRVQKFHREHNRHHLSYTGDKGIDWEALVIDWECSRFTKESAPLNARETAEKYREIGKITEEQYKIIDKTIKRLGID